jgi:sigma-B regulation protein RsbU (phosphoserine phosphatase)
MKFASSFKLFVLLAVLTVLTAGCTPATPADNPISKNWFYAVGSMNDTIADTEFYTFKKLRSFSSLDRLHPDRKGVLWFKTSFTIPETLKEKNLSLLLGYINPTDISYLNGQYIGETGIAPFTSDHFFSDWNSYRKYDIHKSMLTDEENVLLIKYYANYEGSIEGKIILGERETVTKIYNVLSFVRTDINAIIACIMFLIGLYHLLIYFKRPKDTENLYYALLSIFFSIYQTNFFITSMPFNIHYFTPYVVHQKVILIALYISVFCAIQFINRFLQINVPKAVQIIYGTIFLLIILATGAAPEYRYISEYSKIINAAIALPMIAYILVVSVILALKKNRAARILLLGLLPFMASILFDVIVHNILLMDDMIYIGGFGFATFLISIMFMLANKFVSYHNEVENLNITLDKKVEDRTEELLRAKEDIEAAMVKLESTNNSLTASNKQLEDAHNIMKRDMTMAANVQESFFPKVAPATEEWETAFTFQPMSGVSGDFYDFFMLEKHLYGAALFDVSGHGIASGLITMIAKSVLIRNFTRNRNLMLNQLMQKINRELIHEIGGVDNYLTGILLRFINGKVEYVNAGHTDLLMKNGKTGEVKVVRSENEAFRGHFLGIEAMNEAYNMLRFNINSGDSLLLYSDCLTESLNSSQQEYGIDRLIKTYSELQPTLPAQVQLDAIVHDLNQYVGSSELKDDLTIIVLKRT